ncbi:MAG: DNA-binding protein [Candidatus Levybacteria bacterium]|nr:DNA-binding protein [Candidatus Levybacteria bacterium]
MRVIYHQNKFSILRFDKGDDVPSALATFCEKNDITAGFFSGLGACEEITISYYDLEKKQYLDLQKKEDLEIVSLTGNIAVMDEKTLVHAHGVFSDRNFTTVAGHVKQLRVSATCEVHLTILPNKTVREYDKKTGLNLMKS